MPHEAEDRGADHVAMHQRLGRDLEEADACLSTAFHGTVGLQNPPPEPELLEDSATLRIGRLEDLGAATHLDGGWGEKPQEPATHRHDERHLRLLRDVAGLL